MECLKCHTPLPDNSRFCFACGADQTGGGTGGTTSGEVAGLQTRLQRIVEGKYQLKKLVGKGGMGAVFLAQDLTLDREVAIKVLPPDISADPKVIQRFQQEAKTAAKLDHTNIIPIYRVESEGGLNYFIMKFIAGTSLEDVLEEKKSLPTDYIQRVLWEAACALGHAHQRSIVHRDVKPANIMFDHDGRVMLTDFGISKALQSASGFTGTGMIIGTPHYMAPEQAKGQPVDGRADQYSLGVVGYRMLTGQLPFSGDSVHTILYKHIFEEAPRTSSVRQGVPPFISEAIARALSKEPDQRFPTMEDFATAVWPEQPVSAPKGGKASGVTSRPRPRPVTAESPTEAVSSAPTTPMPRPGGGARKPEPKRSKAGLLVGGGLAAVAVLGIGGYMVLGGGTPAADTPEPQPPSQASPAPQQTEPPPVVIPETVRVQVPAPTPSQSPPRRSQPAGQRPAAQQPQQSAPTQTTPPPPAPAEEWGYITIDATPVSATVYVDGVEAGFTPLASYRVKPGVRTIRLQAEGYKIVTERLQVDVGNTVRKRYPLIPEG